MTKDKHRDVKEYKKQLRAKEWNYLQNPYFSPEFRQELRRDSLDEEDARKQVSNKSRFKVTVSGPVVEVWEYENGVRYGKQGPRPDREEVERIRTEEGLTVDPETGEIIYDRMASRMQYMRAAKNDFRRLINANFTDGSKFITLTFRDGSVSDVTNVQECNKAFDKFIKRMRREYGDFKYARVIEFQDSNGRGAVHYHLIFDGLPYIPYEKLGEIWGNGFIGINRIEHVDNVGAYIRKYMAQDMEDKRLMRRKAFATSQNLVRPYDAYGVEAVELIEALELKQKKEVYGNVYDGSEYQGMTNYKEYNFAANEEYRGRKDAPHRN